MADRAEIEVVISAQADRVLAGLASFERSLKLVEQAHLAASTAATTHGAKVDNVSTKLQMHGSSVEHLATQLRQLANIGQLFIAWQAIEHGLDMLKGIETFNIDLLRTTELLGGNAQAASTWSAIANIMGIDANLVDRAFAKLSTDLNSTGNPALKQMGIAAEDANGKLRPLNDVINQAADYFHAHAGAVNNAALANALFGRAGYQLLPILEQGKAGLAAFTEEARKYGLILDSETIQRNAAFTFQLKEAEMAGRGLAISFGNALLPGIAALGQAFSRVVQDNLPAFIAAINRAVSYVIGMVEGMTGMALSVDKGALALSDFSGTAADTGSAMDKAGSAAAALAEKQRQITDAARAATAAIDDQIRALNAQKDATAFKDKQANLAESIANKEKDIQKLQQEQYIAYWQGNFQTAASIGEQITRAKQDEEDLNLQITRSSEDEQLKAKIAGLEEHKRHINDTAQKQIEAMQRAAAASKAAFETAAGSMPPLFDKAGKAAAEKFKFAMDAGAESTGLSMGKKLMDAIFGPETSKLIFDGGGHWHREFARSGGEGFVKIGQVIGEAIGQGLVTALGKSVNEGLGAWWGSYVRWLHDGVGPGGHLNQPPPKMGASAQGGIFTQPTLTWVAEAGVDEAIVPADAVRTLARFAAMPATPSGFTPGHLMPGASPLPSMPSVPASSPELALRVTGATSPDPTNVVTQSSSLTSVSSSTSQSERKSWLERTIVGLTVPGRTPSVAGLAAASSPQFSIPIGTPPPLGSTQLGSAGRDAGSDQKVDLTETNATLHLIVDVLRLLAAPSTASSRPTSPPGTDAMIAELLNRVTVSRSRGMAGAYGR